MVIAGFQLRVLRLQVHRSDLYDEIQLAGDTPVGHDKRGQNVQLQTTYT